MKKPTVHPKMPRLFQTHQRLSVGIHWETIPEANGARFHADLRHSLAQIAGLGIFESVDIAESSVDCDVFISFGKIQLLFTGDLVGETTFPRHPSGKRYAQVKMESRIAWGFETPAWYQFWIPYRPRLARWLNHELLHAIGLSHTNEKVSTWPSILDENNWVDNRIDIPSFDRAYARYVYRLSDPAQSELVSSHLKEPTEDG